MDVEERADLVGSQCGPECNAEIVEGVHRGVAVFWASHGGVSNALPDGATAAGWMAERHREQAAQQKVEDEKRHGLSQPTSTGGGGEPLIEGVPA